MPAFTTADASERLAKRQAAKQLGVSAGIGSGVKAKIKKPNLLQSAVRGLGTVYDYAKNQPGTQSTNPINTGAGVSMGTITNPIQSTVEPTRLALRRAVGDITAIPGVGQPSASPTATDIRSGNWEAPAMDYAGLAVELLPGSIPAYKEAREALGSAIAKTVSTPPFPQPKQIVRAVADPRQEAMELAKEIARSRSKRFKANYYPQEMGSLGEYLGQNYHDIQSYLRMLHDTYNNEDELLKIIGNMDKLFTNAPRVRNPVTVMRGVKPSFYDKDYLDWLMSHDPGDIINEEGFLSTTMDPRVAEGFSGNYRESEVRPGVLLNIQVPPNTPFISPQHRLYRWNPFWTTVNDTKLPNLGVESEILLPRNQQLEVLANDRARRQMLTRLLPG